MFKYIEPACSSFHVTFFRPMKPNEMFEVRLDKMVAKWAGSIEIGVTTHAPNDLGRYIL